MKRLVSLILALILITSLVPTALAASDEAINAAQTLYNQGLFSGTGTDTNGNPNFDLDRAPTRHEAVTMLVRLLGKASEAESGTWNIPFTDVAEWAKPYVGYAYTNGLTAGTSATTYDGNQIVTASQYLTFVLRALGYQVGTDFQWDKAWELSDKIGLTDGRYNSNTTNFTRGDVAIISLNSLNISNKSGTENLYTIENIQGIWRCNGKDYDEEYIFSGTNYTCARTWKENGTPSGGYSLCTGTYELGNELFTYDCEHTYVTERDNSLQINRLNRSEKLVFNDENSFSHGGNQYYRTPNIVITSEVREQGMV